jgi:disulfide bond formation protein DsbB
MKTSLASRLLAPRTAAGLAALAAAALLIAIFTMEYAGGLAPCKLCILQRWPHGAALGLGLVGTLAIAGAPLRQLVLWGCAIAFAITAGMGFYHAGVEFGVLEGPSTCTGLATGDTVEQLRNSLMAAPVVRCDEVSWALFGISLAGYNAIISTLLAAFSATAAYRVDRLRL